MNRPWGGRWKSGRWDSRDPWQHREEESGYGWLKRLLASALIFAAVYGAQASDTAVGRTVTGGVRYILTTETDFAYLAGKLTEFSPKNMDVSVLKRVHNTVLKPADPLQYMTRPTDGKLVASFGWQTDPVSKQAVLNEGIVIEAPPGTAVKAAAAGRVKLVADSAQYGKVLIIEHSREIDSVYGYLGEALVTVEETVSQGQVIARSGKNSMTALPVLYFEIREKGKAIDPLSRIKGGAQ